MTTPEHENTRRESTPDANSGTTFVVAVDGPAGSGKSSVSKAAAAALGYAYLSALDRLRDMLPFINFIESKRLLANLFIMLICCGAVVSLIASLIAVEKFIRKASKPL